MGMEENVEAVVEAAIRPGKGKKADTAYRLIVVILLLCLLCINLFMQNKYVTRDDYKADQKNEKEYRDKQDDLMAKMHDEIVSLINSDKINAAQNEELRDHEARIRRLEAKARIAPPDPSP